MATSRVHWRPPYCCTATTCKSVQQYGGLHKNNMGRHFMKLYGMVFPYSMASSYIQWSPYCCTDPKRRHFKLNLLPLFILPIFSL